MKYFDKTTNSFHPYSNARYSETVYGMHPVLIQDGQYEDREIIMSEAQYDQDGNLTKPAEIQTERVMVSEPIYEYEPIVLKEPELLNADELWLEMTDEVVDALFAQAKAEEKVIAADTNGFPALMMRPDIINYEEKKPFFQI